MYSTIFININNSLVGLFLCIVLWRRNLPCFFFIHVIYISLLHIYIFIIIMRFMVPIPPKKIFIRMSCIDVNRFCHCSSFLNRLFLCVLLCYRCYSCFINISQLCSWFCNLISDLFALIFNIILIYLIRFLNCLIINIYFFVLIQFRINILLVQL